MIQKLSSGIKRRGGITGIFLLFFFLMWLADPETGGGVLFWITLIIGIFRMALPYSKMEDFQRDQ
ncbi:hypothetical protein PVA45_07050 [Entomospira entomophila]|uniref:Uncharacterized protein n=1 Tax=Entomospira entomophila TaxID=2719988 RepID=A0A968GCU8_9SPIO|nr:hypothetical protein [Entomospira entomophilus]NIZ41258.1 hypothetical protein [Entomospira entomophilus]WDI35463.1 hypothetical protein PVA45_07050 [Entomospira entomophilus]